MSLKNEGNFCLAKIIGVISCALSLQSLHHSFTVTSFKQGEQIKSAQQYFILNNGSWRVLTNDV
jgi:predicted small secreted protein